MNETIFIILGIGALGFLLYREYQKKKEQKPQKNINARVLKKEKSFAEKPIVMYIISVLFCVLILVVTIITMFAPHFNEIYSKRYMREIAKPMFVDREKF